MSEQEEFEFRARAEREAGIQAAPQIAKPLTGPDPSEGGGTLQFGPIDTGIRTPQGVDRFLSGMGKSFSDTATGIGQLYNAATGQSNQTLKSIAGGFTPADEQARLDKALMNTGAGVFGNVSGQVAQMAVPGGVAGKLVPRLGAAMAASPYLTSAATAGTFGGLQPVLAGQSRLGNVAQDAIGGLVGQGVGSAVGRLAKGASDKIAPAVMDLYDKAVQAGIPISAAQLSDSAFVKTLQSALSKLPFSGQAAANAEQQGAFNTAVSRTFGENSPTVDSALYNAAKGRIGGDFNSLSARNTLNVSPALLNNLGQVSSDATKFGTSDTGRAVSNAIDEIMSKADASGQIPGQAYQSFDSAMGKLMKGGDEKAHYIGQVRDAVRGAMDQSITPADSAAWQTARQQYANLKTVRDLVAKDTTGDINPNLLMGRVTATGAGKERMAMGNGGDLGDLAQIGKRFLRDPIPDSGTAQRNMLYSLLATAGSGAAGVAGASPTQIGLGLGGAAAAGLLGRGANALLNSTTLAKYAAEGAGPVLGDATANLLARARLSNTVANAGGDAIEATPNLLAQIARAAPAAIPAGLNAASFPSYDAMDAALSAAKTDEEKLAILKRGFTTPAGQRPPQAWMAH